MPASDIPVWVCVACGIVRRSYHVSGSCTETRDGHHQVNPDAEVTR